MVNDIFGVKFCGIDGCDVRIKGTRGTRFRGCVLVVYYVVGFAVVFDYFLFRF